MKQKPLLPMRNCEYCDAPYQPIHTNNRYCKSGHEKGCYYEALKERQRTRNYTQNRKVRVRSGKPCNNAEECEGFVDPTNNATSILCNECFYGESPNHFAETLEEHAGVR